MKVYRRKYKDRQGRERTGKTWWILAYVGGERVHQSLRTKDKRAAELMAGDIVRREELKRAGIVDPFGEHHDRPLKEHVADFEKTLHARGVVKKYLEDRMGCLRAYIEDVGAKHIKDLDLPGASGFLSQVKATGVSARTVNRYYSALKQFGRWLVRTRRVQFDPFDGLKKLNEEADRRHVRRALTPEEAQRLIDAARTRPLSWTFRGKTVEPTSLASRRRLEALGEMRALIYLIAMGRRFHLNSRRKRVPETLHNRILIYQQRNTDVANLLLAVKWLGNEGAHDELLRGDVLDGFEIMEQVLESLYGRTQQRIAQVASEIVRRKGSRRRKRRRER